MTPDELITAYERRLRALGERAKATSAFRWLPGMRSLPEEEGPRFGMAQRICDHTEMPLFLEDTDDGPRWTADCGSAWPEEPGTPDLSDAATKGCILELVREAYADPNALWGGRIEVHQDHHQLFEVVQPYHDDMGGLEYHHIACGEIEEEALVVALEKAPRRKEP